MLAQAEEFVSLLTKARDTVKAHVELAKSYVEQGMLVRSELLRAEVELARVEDLLEDAKGKARVANANLAFRIGVAQDSTWQLAPLPGPKPLDGDAASWVASAASRKDLAAARSLLRAGELEEKVKKAAWFPKVGVSARWDLHDKNLFGASGSAGTVMAFAAVNLFQGGADKAAVAAAREEARAGREDVARFADGVALEVRQAYEEAVDRPRPPRHRRQGARVRPRERADHRRALQERRRQDDRPPRRGDRSPRGRDARARRPRRRPRHRAPPRGEGRQGPGDGGPVSAPDSLLPDPTHAEEHGGSHDFPEDRFPRHPHRGRRARAHRLRRRAQGR